MRRIARNKRFLKDFALAYRRGKTLAKLELIIEKLASNEKLETRYRPHALKGDWKGYMECHIEPDWLLIYRYEGDFLILARTGTHSDLFRK